MTIRGIVLGPRALWAIGIALLLAASALTFGIVAAINKIDPPDLAVKTAFPEHYDTHVETLGAVAYGGQAKCLGLLNPMMKPTLDGIVFSEGATAGRIVAANPLSDPRYEIEGEPSTPRSYPRNVFPTYRSGTCQYDYWADLWETRVTVTNRVPIQILDDHGVPHSFMLTPIRPDGGVSTYVLHGRSPFASELILAHEVFPEDNYRPSARFHHNATGSFFVENDTFAFLFEIPPLTAKDEVMLLAMPLRWDGTTARAVGPSDLEFTALHKLRPQEAHLVLATKGAHVPQDVGDVALLDRSVGKVYSGEALVDVYEQAREDDAETALSRDLEATSSVAFLTYEAVEPRAKPGKTKLVQLALPASHESAYQIEVTSGAKSTTAAVDHKWTTGSGNPKLIVRLSHESTTLAKPVADAARVTAALTQMGADGAVIAKSIADGTNADDAVRVAARGLSSRAQLAELTATTAPAGEADALAKSAQRYLAGAAGLEAGWYLVKASSADDALTRLDYENRAAHTAMSGLLVLTGEGAIAVAVVSLAEWGAHKIGAPALGTLIHNAVEDVGGLVTGKPTTHGAREALQDAAGRIRAYALENEAAIFEPASRDTPFSPAVGLAALALAAAYATSGRRRS